MLPLPALNLQHWPYEKLFPNRAAYVAAVLPQRLQRLRALFADHTPTYVVCYGSGYWEHYQQLWPDAKFMSAEGGWMQLARVGESCIAFVPFFRYDQMSNTRVQTLAAALIALANARHDAS